MTKSLIDLFMLAVKIMLFFLVTKLIITLVIKFIIT